MHLFTEEEPHWMFSWIPLNTTVRDFTDVPVLDAVAVESEEKDYLTIFAPQ